MIHRQQQLLNNISHHRQQRLAPIYVPSGVLIRVVGLTLEARGCKATIGSLCSIESHYGDLIAEVIGFNDDIIYLMPVNEIRGVFPGAKVTPLNKKNHLQVGDKLLGRILDGNGEPIDNKGSLIANDSISRKGSVINPLSRQAISQPLDVGVRTINTMLTVGKGQRMGLFAGSGVGKSVLLGMMTQGTQADVIVVGLVGERGREVKEFIDVILDQKGLSRAVVVAAPADTSPLMRLRACESATRIAEYYRDQGLDVLLLMDSLTRYAQAQREIALAVGEPPATKGYPPSVFAKLPKLVERAGNAIKETGSITAFYTILTENDDLHDPIADASRAILDGHIVLSRSLADAGQYPAIDIEKSISRVAPMVISNEHLLATRKIKLMHSIYSQNQDLISIGAYVNGTDKKIDKAIQLQPLMNAFFSQNMDEIVSFDESLQMLYQLAQCCEE